MSRRRMPALRLPLRRLVLLLALPPAQLGAQASYGFVSRLGRDTVSVERIVRTADHLSGDVIERYPIVRISHYEAQLASDGSITRFVIDQRWADAPSSPTERMELTWTGDSLRVSLSTDMISKPSVIATHGRLLMPWLLSAYGTSEQLLLAAGHQPGDSVVVATYTVAGTLRGTGSTVLRTFHADSASIEYRGRPMIARFDSDGRIARFSGDRTTNKEEVSRVEMPPDIDRIATEFEATARAAGDRPLALSPRDTARGRIGGATLLIDYSRPRLRGRRAIGRLVPIDTVWRTGADEATQLEISSPVHIAGIALAPGHYTLWTVLTRGGPMLIVNRQTGQWGTDYDPACDLARAPLRSVALSAPIEAFTIRIEAAGPTTGRLVLEWDDFRWIAAITAR